MSGRRRSSGRGQSSLGYLFSNSDELEEQRGHDHFKAVSSPWVSISGGGQSSLGYLFGSNAPILQQQGVQESELSSPPVCVPPYGVDDDQVIMAEDSPEKPLSLPSKNRKSSYVYHKVDGQNSREFLLTGRPSTRVTSVPGGDSSVGYLFGDK